MGRWILLALVGVISAMAGNARAREQLRPVSTGDLIIGALARPSEAGRWILRQTDDRYIIACNDAHCRGDLIDVTVTPDAGDTCDEAMLAELVGLGHPGAFDKPELLTIARPGFAIKAALIDMGCRNWTGSPVQACSAVAGDLYMFSADAGGCRETPPDFERPVLEFLNGLVLAQP
jgi:hypothetical protein